MDDESTTVDNVLIIRSAGVGLDMYTVMIFPFPLC